MLVPIDVWAEKAFSFPISKATLNNYAKTKQISSPPQKVARKWCCDVNAKFVGLPTPQTDDITDPLVREILYGGNATNT